MSFQNPSRVFGRKPVQTIPRPEADADGRTRILPKTVFEGQSGEFLKMLGRTPDDPGNFIPSEADYDARIEASRQRMIVQCDEVEEDLRARFGHGVIRPYFVFGEDVWNGKAGSFLNRTLELQPYDGWNLVPLANDDRTMALSGLPHHPGCNIQIIDEKALQYLAPIYTKFMDSLDALNPNASDFLDRLRETDPVTEKEALRQGAIEVANNLKSALLDFLGDFWRRKGKTCPR